MTKSVVHIHPGGRGTTGRRDFVVRAPSSLDELRFFLQMKEKMKSATMSDLIRHCCVRIALEEKLDIELPESWRALYGVE